MDDGPRHRWLRAMDERTRWTTSVCTGSLILAALGTLAPLLFLSFRTQRRTSRFEAQLADILMLLASSLRAGHSFLQALDMVAQEMGEDMGPDAGGMSGMDSMMTGMMRMMVSSTAWFVNGVAADENRHDMEPMLKLERGKSHVIAMTNATAWHHPIHLHGHSFRVISRNGRPTRHREWQDTVLMSPREKVEIAFVADNPGDWMLHCHVLEHQAGGMMGLVRVA
jgi:FtsP/CotA-like multicopper oxidase with cupredoxin domain